MNHAEQFPSIVSARTMAGVLITTPILLGLLLGIAIPLIGWNDTVEVESEVPAESVYLIKVRADRGVQQDHVNLAEVCAIRESHEGSSLTLVFNGGAEMIVNPAYKAAANLVSAWRKVKNDIR